MCKMMKCEIIKNPKMAGTTNRIGRNWHEEEEKNSIKMEKRFHYVSSVIWFRFTHMPQRNEYTARATKSYVYTHVYIHKYGIPTVPKNDIDVCTNTENLYIQTSQRQKYPSHSVSIKEGQKKWTEYKTRSGLKGTTKTLTTPE